jgi:hypothetical protein
LLLAATRGTESAVGTVTVNVDGAAFTTLSLTAAQSDVMTTVDLSNYASTGAHNVALSFAGTGRPSYNLVATHHLPWASVPPEPLGPLSIDVAYDKTLLRVNETARATVTVHNNTSSTQNMVLITVGVPPGFTVATEDLDGYKTSGVLSHYEVMPAQVTLYVSELAPSSAAALSYRLTATMPVRVADGGAEAYLYYEPAERVVAEAQTVEAQP